MSIRTQNKRRLNRHNVRPGEYRVKYRSVFMMAIANPGVALRMLGDLTGSPELEAAISRGFSQP